MNPNRKPIKPHALKAGDTVAVVASAAAVERAYLERGVNALAAMGYRVKVSERVLARSGILAGDDRDRASELAGIFRRPRGQGDLFRARRLRMRTIAAAARLQRDRDHAQNLRRLLGRDISAQRACRFRRDGIVSRPDGRDGFCKRPEPARARSSARIARRQARRLRARGSRGDASGHRARRSHRRMPVGAGGDDRHAVRAALRRPHSVPRRHRREGLSNRPDARAVAPKRRARARCRNCFRRDSRNRRQRAGDAA